MGSFARPSSILHPPSSLPENLHRLAVLALALLSLAATAHACGPFFPNNLLEQGDRALLAAPFANFASELGRLHLAPSRFEHLPATNGYAEQSFDGEMADLGAALKKAKVPGGEHDRIVEAHRVNREKLLKFQQQLDEWNARYPTTVDGYGNPMGMGVRETMPTFPSFAEVSGLPGEFADYFAGAVASHNPDTGEEEAREAWERLLQRPAAERKYKSTWAAFMLGKSWEGDDDDKAVEYFQMTRELAKQRFADSIGLAPAAIGLEARVELGQKNFKRALELYLEQYSTSDGSAVTSLRCVAEQALSEGGDALAALAAAPNTRSVITAWMICDEHRDDHAAGESPATLSTRAWLAAIEAAGVKDVESAERLALAAYQVGEFDLAQRWVTRARNTSVAQWLQAKLLLRAGKTQEAAGLLAKVANLLPVLPDHELTNSTEFAESLSMQFEPSNWDFNSVRAQVLVELGVLKLSRGEFTQSLDALLRSGFWENAAYVAERVLTTDELKDYVERNWRLVPAEQEAEEKESFQQEKLRPAVQRLAIRYLLGRRLTRELRGGEAREFYPAEWQPRFDELVAALNSGWNESSPPDQRAKSLFNAAVIARTNGLELLGTEVQPDWHICDGQGVGELTWQDRATNAQAAVLNVASAAEIRRAAQHRADPEARFHYRYQAAFLAWEAAKLMPNNSDETARVLWTAGRWLKGRDAETADYFYKALVRRCRKTELGAEADRQRWFPEVDAEGHVVHRATTAKAVGLSIVAEGNETPEPPAGSDSTEAAPDQPEEIASPDTADVPGDEHGYEYVLRLGDSLASVARIYSQHGIPMTVKQILPANPGLDPARLRVGQKIFVPASSLPIASPQE